MIPLSELLGDCEPFNTTFQGERFVTLRNGGTLYGCYFQSLRELSTMTIALRSHYAKFDLSLIDIDEWENGEAKTEFDKRRNKIRAREMRASLNEGERIIAKTEEQFILYYGLAVAIREQLESEGVEFPMTQETKYRLDREMWSHRLRCSAAVELNTQGRLGGTTLELLQSLPKEMKAEVCPEIFRPDAQQYLLQWFMEFDLELPAPKLFLLTDARKLVGDGNGYVAGGGRIAIGLDSWKCSA